MKSALLRSLSLVALVGVAIGLRYVYAPARTLPSQILTVQRPLMGTVWNLEVVDRGHPDQARAAVEKAYAELERIDALMSEWKPESPISQVNAAAGQHPVEVPAELRELLQRSIAYSKITEGTFDITWRGMGNIWHFDDAFIPPAKQAVAAAKARVDYRKVAIDGNRVFLPAGMNIGLGGIAKGYAVDRATEVLMAAGFGDALVDGGGDIRVAGTRLGEPWRLGIQDPRRQRGTLLGAMRLSNCALVTSGDYERFRIVDGVRYHHIIDPRTGYPASASISVSVMSRTAEQGVVLAKGVFMLGPEKGLELARQQGIEVLLIDPQQKRYATPGFAQKFEKD
ncbi:MAG TPA: FAD:protein FMN transferase [Bryobacteraceae bacterium]|nr:FAD:protein FMN transferase [Bryobacteraceae bacterium]